MTDTSGRFKVYTASAGSGKTFMLTVEYLTFALRNPELNYRRILAITFTKKATREMKSRILNTCRAFATYERGVDGGVDSFMDNVMRNSGLEEDEVMRRSQVLYRKILHNYSDFAVNTIDSFCQRIIRAFAFELNLPINFEVELDTDNALKALKDSLLQKVGDDRELTQLIEHLFLTNLEELDQTNIDGQIIDSGKILLKEDSMEHMKQFDSISNEQILKIRQRLSEATDALEAKARLISGHIITTADSFGLSPSDFTGGSRSFVNIIRQIADGDRLDITLGARKKMAEEAEAWFSKKKLQEVDTAAIGDDLYEPFADLIDAIDTFDVYDVLRKKFNQVVLLSHVYQTYKDYQRSETKVFINEFNQLISEEVKTQPAPFVYEKIGELYDYILIDEFQDTSVMQWQNLVPLITEGLSRSADSTSLVVGDSKQAIYRWKGGETQQLSALPALMGSEDNPYMLEHEQVLAAHHTSIPMDNNYRSSKDIVDFNNALYAYIFDHDNLSFARDIYNNYHQVAQKTKLDGFVHIHQYPKIETKGIDREVVKQEKEARSLQRLEDLVENIRKITGRGYALSDIAVLTRGNKELSEIADFLRSSGISFVSEESLRMDSEPMIRAFINMYEVYLNPYDQIKGLELATQFQHFGLLDVDRHTLNKTVGATAIYRTQDYSDMIHQWNEEIHLERVYSLSLLEAWEEFVSWIPQEMLSPVFIAFFREYLFGFVTNNGNDYEKLVEWWQKEGHRQCVRSNEGVDGVQLLTIHKSKGLEYDIVILPYIDWNVKKNEELWLPTAGDVFEDVLSPMTSVYIRMQRKLTAGPMGDTYDAELAKILIDQINMLYVATTRAVRELYISVGAEKLDVAEMSNMGTLIADFLAKNGGGDSYSIGSPTTPLPKKKSDAILLPLDMDFETGEMAHVSIKSRASTIWNEAITDKISHGTLIHSLMEQIHSVADIEPRIQQGVRYGWLTESDAPRYVEDITTLANHTDIAPFFDTSNTILSERSIIDETGREYIPDRLWIDGDTAHILDFKTGLQEDRHHKQVMTYAEVLHQMGYSTGSIYLVYLDPVSVVRVV